MDWNSWGPPLIATTIGLASGFALVFNARRGDARDERAQTLRAHKAGLMDRLRELELERPKLPASTYEEERRALVAQAAATLRELEELEGTQRPSSAGLGLPIAAAAAITVASVLVVVWPESSAAPAASIDDAPTGGSNPHAMAEMAAQGDELPDDLDKLNDMAYRAILAGQLPTAMGAVEKARQMAPDDPLVRIHLDVMRINVGMVDRAAEDLDDIVAEYPDQVRAILWLAYAKGQRGDEATAREMLEQVLEKAPDSEEATMARSWLMEIDKAQGMAPAP